LDIDGRWPLVLVRWLDSASPKGWQSLSAWPGIESLECVSVGFLYHDGEHTKTIVPHFAWPNDDANRSGNGVMVIPSGAIISMEHLRPVLLVDLAH
jgi:hypothetical protein